MSALANNQLATGYVTVNESSKYVPIFLIEFTHAIVMLSG